MAFYESWSYENGYYYPQWQSQSQSQSQSEIPWDDNNGYYSYYSSSPPPSSGFSSSYCEYLPPQSLVAYDPASISTSTHCVVYHSVAAAPAPAPAPDHLDFEEYEAHPFRGGYDIGDTYGKPLPPTDDICYPRSSLPPHNLHLLPSLPSPSPSPSPGAATATTATATATTTTTTTTTTTAPAPTTEEDEQEDDDDDQEQEQEAEEDIDDDDDDQEQEQEQEGEEEDADTHQSIQVYGGGYDDGRVGNQNPHGYALETFDLCENLFGYWPCLSRIHNNNNNNNNNCHACGQHIRGAQVDQWTRTADYLFGNPDPYTGWEDEAPGYATPNRVYAYPQMQYPRPTSTLYHHQPHQYAQNSWFP